MPAPIVVIGAKQLLGSSRGRQTLTVAVGAVVALVVGGLIGVLVLVGAGGNILSGGAGAAAAAATDDESSAQTCFEPGTDEWTIPIGESYTVTSEFGEPRDSSSAPTHTGIDLASGSDRAPIYAASSGRITEIRNLGDSSYGLYLRIDHGGGVETLYAHLSGVKDGVRQGMQVKTGQRIATEGGSGGVTGPHLHYETILRGTPINPREFMKRKSLTFDGKPGGATGTNADTQETQTDQSFTLPKPNPNDVDQAVPGAKAGRIPKRFLALYKKAGANYGLPWQLLAGVGWEESRHTADVGGSYAGAQGPMQFMPSTWEQYGVDGNRDGKRDIHDPADAIPAAASYLKASGATGGGKGVKKALWAYNHASWYVNDVLTWAWQYAEGGDVTVQQDNCVGGSDSNVGNVADGAIADVLEFAASQEGDDYMMGGVGPHYWDCSGLVMKAYEQIGLTLPRTAAAQRAWLAKGNGKRIRLGNEKPGDLVFYDSYRGPDQVGHVALVWNAKKKKTIEAATTSLGVGFFSYADNVDNNLFEIWRPGKS